MSLSQLSTHFLKQELAYTGVELSPHFLLSRLGLKGQSLGAFIGGCDVKTEHLVDWEDRLVSDHIKAKWMVHFIGEFFGATLREGVWIQRLFMATLAESLNESLIQAGGPRVRRSGDDLFVGEGDHARKLSVSIVTASPVSVLMHSGINIDPEGAPVPAIGLSELGVAPEQWVPEVLSRFQQEWESIQWACTKVRAVV